MTGGASPSLGAAIRERLRLFLERPTVSALVHSKAFWAGVIFKLVLGSLLASTYLRDLFIPFVNYFAESGFANPWQHFEALGRLKSFPYPPVMLYVMALPRWLLGWLVPAGVDAVTPLHLLLMRLPLLVCDVLIAGVLVSWLPNRLRHILLFYWWSPLAIYIIYWHGQLDVVPTALLMLSLYALRTERRVVAMIVFGLALAAKSHLLVALPFYYLYLRHQTDGNRALRWTALSLATYALAIFPYVLDPAFRQMVFLSPEQSRLWAFQLPVAFGGPAIVLAPLAILLLWFRFDMYQKQNWDLFITYLGISFCVLVTLAPPQPGYVLWFLPFFVYFAARSRPSAVLPLHIYTGAYVVYFALRRDTDLFDAWRLVAPAVADLQTPHQVLSLALGEQPFALLQSFTFTLMAGSMAGLVLLMYLVGLRSNEVYRLRTRPVVLGLAGDSGSGKDYFSRLLADVLGSDRTLDISGDDYHRWPRGHEMWQVHTHLDVRANELHRQQGHAVAISRGESIVKGVYDHDTGTFTEEEEIDPKQYVIFSGLHTLALRTPRKLYDLTVFLDPEEDLRRLWKLRRDVDERGHSREQVLASLEEREEDRQRFILPQRKQANLVISMRPAEGESVDDQEREPELVLEVTASNSFHLGPLVEAMGELTDVEIRHDPYRDAIHQSLALRGDVSEARLGAVATAILPNLYELSQAPRFRDGLDGCLQLLTLVCLDEVLRWRQ
ncbi:MAG: hypothetical protein GY719_23520 [bacterium]|nr:hypothetical protein [bacterium]